MPTSIPTPPPAGSVPAMSPKIYEGPSAYGPDNDDARRRAEAEDLTPMRVVDIAAWLGVAQNTISRGWIADRDTVKDPERKFPEATWPDQNLWAKGVVRKWAEATGRLTEDQR